MQRMAGLGYSFEDLRCMWYRDFLINSDTVTDNTGFDNGIFKAFGFSPFETIPNARVVRNNNNNGL